MLLLRERLMRVASVILDIPTQSLEGAYSYLAPDELVEAEVGCAVLVPFGHRQAVGYIIALDEVDGDDTQAWQECSLDPAKLKSIGQVLTRSYFNEEAAACALFLSERYIAPLSSCVRLFTPPGGVPRMVRQGANWQVEEPVVKPVDDRWVSLAPAGGGYVPKANAVKQRAILEALGSGDLRVAELAVEFGAVSATLTALAKIGAIEVSHR
ncbi:MAG: primosomal protein N', partial [Eggerthellaceae bacterium]|nr:primosomal protein N' [Eggerthellaceae bacterium]